MKENSALQKSQLRLIIAIPFITTLLVLGFGLLIIYLNQKQLLAPNSMPNTLKVHQALGDIVTATIIAAIGALITGIILAYALTRPIREFTASTKKILQGDFTSKITYRSTTEFSQLADSFNQMILSLNNFFKRSPSGGMITFDKNKNILSLSIDAEILLGCTSAELTGKHINESFLGKDENSDFRNAIVSSLENQNAMHQKELHIRNMQGELLTVSLSSSLIDDENFPELGLTVKLEDLTDIRRVQEQMRRIDRIAAFNSFAAGVAHNVRNPLCSIRGFAQLINERAAQHPELKEYTSLIIKDVDRINTVIEHLIHDLRPGTPDWDYHKVDDVVKETLYQAREDIK
ncbi:MAG: HAMP domain-containing protein [bacterium]